MKFLLIVILITAGLAPVYAQLKIMPLGDSITQGELLVTDTSQPIPIYKPDGRRGLAADGRHGILAAGDGGYRLPLEQMLAGMGWDFEMVGQRTEGGGHHEGYPGYMTTDILPMLPEMLELNDPDVVLLHIGTNDLPKPIDADSCYVNILEMLDIIHDYNRDIEIVLAQIIPCLQNTKLGRDRYPEIIRLNDLLTDVTTSRNYVSLVNMWDPFVEATDWENKLMSDSWHPNHNGYYLMAQIWRDELGHVIHGRAPMISAINPASGYLFETSFQITLEGDYFRRGIAVQLLPETGAPLEAFQVEYENSSLVHAWFDLSHGAAAPWQVQAINSNKMRSIFSPDFLFTIRPNSFSLSGTVKNSGGPLPGVTLTLTHSSGQNITVTHADGFFEFHDVPGLENYTLSAAKSGWRLRPGRIEMADLRADRHDLNFSGEPVKLAGEIFSDAGTPLPDVQIICSGATDTTLLTDPNGKFELNPAPAGNLALTAEKAYWQFEPDRISMTLDTSDVTIKITGSYNPPYFSLAGHILEKNTNQALSGVRVQLAGFFEDTLQTDSTGFFQFDHLRAFENYTLRPTHPDYQFQPESLHFKSLQHNEIVEFEGQYLATAKSIAGTVRDPAGNPAAGIPLNLTGGATQSVPTDENGSYQFTGLAPRQRYVIRSNAAWVKLQPDSLVFASLEENLFSEDFNLSWRGFPPFIVNLGPQTVDEGTPFAPISLREHVQDADSDPEEIFWTIKNAAPLHVEISLAQICQVTPPDPDWYGKQRVQFIARDTDGLEDSVWVDLTVKNVNDPPRPFHLTEAKPVTVTGTGRYYFTWHATSDPDSGAPIQYTLVIGAVETSPQWLREISAGTDTTLETELDLVPGEYTWSVRASDGQDTTRCAETGQLWIGKMSVATRAESPAEFALHPNFPNPFNPSTVIAYDLPRAAMVKITIFDALGHEVFRLHDGPQIAGRHQLIWHARNQKGQRVSSGIYFCKMECPDFVKTVEMSLVK